MNEISEAARKVFRETLEKISKGEKEFICNALYFSPEEGAAEALAFFEKKFKPQSARDCWINDAVSGDMGQPQSMNTSIYFAWEAKSKEVRCEILRAIIDGDLQAMGYWQAYLQVNTDKYIERYRS